MIRRETIVVQTRGRGTYELSAGLTEFVAAAGIETGLLSAFVKHTSASLIVCENADPAVRRDLERWFARAVPDGDPDFEHSAEGPDDMPAHVRTVLTQTAVTLPIEAGACALGTWQSLYLYEHRAAPHRRRVVLTALGE